MTRTSIGARDPLALKAAVGAGLLSFPVTAFDSAGDFAPAPYARLVERAANDGATALFAAGGTGEFFSIAPSEYATIIASAVAAAGRKVPIIAGCGYGTRMAVELAQAAEKAGADGLLLLPHYLIAAEQDGLYNHVKAVCDSVRIGVIVYNRDNSILQPHTLERLCKACPNLIGFKDGCGDIELVLRITSSMGDRLVYVGGMPTHEVYASAYFAAGVTTYSSAVYNFIPQFAVSFYEAVRRGDREAVDGMLRSFFWPYLELRNRRRGYAVSIIKAGMRSIGLEDPGPVRPPLTDLTADEEELLARILAGLG